MREASCWSLGKERCQSGSFYLQHLRAWDCVGFVSDFEKLDLHPPRYGMEAAARSFKAKVQLLQTALRVTGNALSGSGRAWYTQRRCCQSLRQQQVLANTLIRMLAKMESVKTRDYPQCRFAHKAFSMY